MSCFLLQIASHAEAGPLGRLNERGQTTGWLGSETTASRSRLWPLTLLKLLQNVVHILGSQIFLQIQLKQHFYNFDFKFQKKIFQIYIKIVIDLNHWRIDTRAKTFDFTQCKQFVFGRFAHVNAQIFFDGMQNAVAIAEPARGCGAYLNVVFADRVSDEHCVECGHLVDSHLAHLEHFSHFVHGRYGQPTFQSNQ